MSARKLLRHPVVHFSAATILLSSILLAAVMLLSHSERASATVTACSASVSPSSVVRNTTNDFTFSINNTDSVTYNWIKITRPSPSVWTINGGSGSGWEPSSSSNDITFTDGTLASSESDSLTVSATAADFTSDPTAWTVQVSDDGGGSTFNCSGSLGTAITDPPADAPPQISDIVITDITSSSVTVTWTTNENSNSIVEYGTTEDYGSTESDSSMTTSHSLSLDSLSANTTYYFNIKSTDSGDNTGESGGNSFVTAMAGLTSDPITITNTTTTTRTVTQTPTPTPIPDRTGPAVSLTTDFSKAFLKPPTISGKASDGSGVSKVEYSVDDGKNWNEVDEIPSSGGRFVTFTFTPPPLEDDNYNVRVRATDGAPARNKRISDPYIMVIDRLPPAIGGNIIAIGPQILFPNTKGYLLTSKGAIQKMTLAAAGGPTKIDLLAYHPGASSSAKKYSLTRNSDNGLWSTDLEFNTPGIYQLLSKSVDGAGNTTERFLNKIAVLEPGIITNTDKKVIKDAKVTLYYFEEKYQIWRVWDAASYNQTNPVKTNDQGEFSYLVPSGKYYFDISGGGLAHAQSEIFTIENPTVLNPMFSLKPLKVLLDFWIFKLYFPDFSTTTIPVQISVPLLPEATDSLIGKEAEEISLPTTDGGQFRLSSSRGAPLVLTFMTLWSPLANEQIMALDRLPGTIKAVPIMLGDTLSKAEIFKQKGEYKNNFVVDSDGKTVEGYQLNTLPSHYFLDRRGVIRKIITGILTDKEIADELLEIQ